ncbi:hypothetical protein B0T17DRAFT_522375 [Bombardia bombarda]|uniref:Uncharacterized protein n=1 Tax=Bombardia bombarda TaxID=252184 RepID=A0AA39X6P5_9PEZI|nr:hypothetical protein B0T17DRAFT_522375 [Bombardia bombarda]
MPGGRHSLPLRGRRQQQPLSSKARAKREATKLYLGKYAYLRGVSLSEQAPVLAVSSKFSKGVDPGNVNISQDQFLGLTSVYVRIYQVPETTRERLTKWYEANEPLVKSYGNTEFWHTRQEDHRLGLAPRPSGIPPGATTVRSTQTEAEEAAVHIVPISSGDAVPNHEQSLIVAPRAFCTVTPAARFPRSLVNTRPELVSWSQQGFLANELQAARESLKTMHWWFDQASQTVDNADPLKEVLMVMTKRADNDLERVSQAVEVSSALMEELRSSTALQKNTKKRQISGNSEDGEDYIPNTEEEEEQEETNQRILVKRARIHPTFARSQGLDLSPVTPANNRGPEPLTMSPETPAQPRLASPQRQLPSSASSSTSSITELKEICVAVGGAPDARPERPSQHNRTNSLSRTPFPLRSLRQPRSSYSARYTVENDGTDQENEGENTREKDSAISDDGSEDLEDVDGHPRY